MGYGKDENFILRKVFLNGYASENKNGHKNPTNFRGL